MSAAEPATPTPPPVNDAGGAAVYDITKRKRRTAAAAARGRWTMDGTPRDTGAGDPQRQLADSFEKSFIAHGLTLTDPATARAFTVTLSLVSRALEGAQVQGIVDERQREELAELIEGMAAAPRLI